jgi:tetratricopeptide (TPR) repeat protein
MSIMIGVLGVRAVISLLAPSHPGDPMPPDLIENQTRSPSLIESVVTQALDGKKAPLFESPGFGRAATMMGIAALLVGDKALARTLLAKEPHAALYLAMAQEGAGSTSRAKEILAAHAKLPNAEVDPGALFLAALAFHAEGHRDTADEVLSRALVLASDALDDAFAPDPAVGLVRAALAAIPAESREATTERFAQRLLTIDRRHEAIRLANTLTGAKRARILLAAYKDADPRRALDEADRVLKLEPADEAAAIERLEIHIALSHAAEARRLVAAIGPVSDANRARFDRARASVALEKDGDKKEALDAAQSAATHDPKSDAGLLLLSRALLENGNLDRALSFADALYDRRPTDVDPFEILRAIHEAKGDRSKAGHVALRSEGFRREKERVFDAIARREKVIRAVRDADAGLGSAGLEALRGEEPLLSLPVDLALARLGKAGQKHAARDRILGACSKNLAHFLETTSGYGRYQTSISPYGDVQTVTIALTAADPARCLRLPPSTRKPKH